MNVTNMTDSYIDENGSSSRRRPSLAVMTPISQFQPALIYAGSVLSIENRNNWNTLVQSYQSQHYLHHVITCLLLCKTTLNSFARIRSCSSSPDQARLLSPTIFLIPIMVFDLIQTFHDDAEMDEFASRLRNIGQTSTGASTSLGDHGPSSPWPIDNPSTPSSYLGGLAVSSGASTPSSIASFDRASAFAGSSDVVCNLQNDGQTDTLQRRPSRRGRARAISENPIHCKVPYCQDKSYVKRKWCERHILADHQEFVSEHTDWKKYIFDSSQSSHVSPSEATPNPHIQSSSYNGIDDSFSFNIDTQDIMECTQFPPVHDHLAYQVSQSMGRLSSFQYNSQPTSYSVGDTLTSSPTLQGSSRNTPQPAVGRASESNPNNTNANVVLSTFPNRAHRVSVSYGMLNHPQSRHDQHDDIDDYDMI